MAKYATWFLAVLITLFVINGFSVKDAAAEGGDETSRGGSVVIAEEDRNETSGPNNAELLVVADGCSITDQVSWFRNMNRRTKAELFWSGCQESHEISWVYTLNGDELGSDTLTIEGSGSRRLYDGTPGLEDGYMLKLEVSVDGAPQGELTVTNQFLNNWPVHVQLTDATICAKGYEVWVDPYGQSLINGVVVESWHNTNDHFVLGPYDFSDFGPTITFGFQAYKRYENGQYSEPKALVEFGPWPNPCHATPTVTTTPTLTPTVTVTPTPVETLPAPSPTPTATVSPVSCDLLKVDTLESKTFPYTTDYEIKYTGAVSAFKVEGKNIEVFAQEGNEGTILVKNEDAEARAWVSNGVDWFTTVGGEDACFVEFGEINVAHHSQDEMVVANPASQVKYIEETYPAGPMRDAAMADLNRKLAESNSVLGDSPLKGFVPVWDIFPEIDQIIDYWMTGTVVGVENLGPVWQPNATYVDLFGGTTASKFNGVDRRDGIKEAYQLVSRSHMQAEMQLIGPATAWTDKLQKHYLRTTQPAPTFDDRHYTFKVEDPDSPIEVQDMTHVRLIQNNYYMALGYHLTNESVPGLEERLGKGAYSLYLTDEIDSYANPAVKSRAQVNQLNFVPTGMLGGKPVIFRVHYWGMEFFYVDEVGNQGWYRLAWDAMNLQPMFTVKDANGNVVWVLKADEIEELVATAPTGKLIGDMYVVNLHEYARFLNKVIELLVRHSKEHPELLNHIVSMPVWVADEVGYEGKGYNVYADAHDAESKALKATADTLTFKADEVENGQEQLAGMIGATNELVAIANAKLTALGLDPIPTYEEAKAEADALKKAQEEAAKNWVNPAEHWTVLNPPSVLGGQIYDQTTGFNWGTFNALKGKATDVSKYVYQVQTGDSYASIAVSHTEAGKTVYAGDLIRCNGGLELTVGAYIIVCSGNYPTVPPESIPQGWEHLVNQPATTVDPLLGAKQGTTGGGISPVVFFAIVVSLLVLAGGGVLVWRRRQAK
jgi:hypothetical protein